MNMKRLLTLVAIFATLQASAQQVNPVPDYVFRNQMSVGRNAVTDTAAYFSIGPRYGATRGMMPPMVVDTASFSGNRRNGLLIFSVQKNKFLYWDSVGVKWAEMAGTGGSAITGSGVTGYIPEFTTTTNLDTTRLFHSNGRFAIGSTNTTNGVFNVHGGKSYFDTTLILGKGRIDNQRLIEFPIFDLYYLQNRTSYDGLNVDSTDSEYIALKSDEGVNRQTFLIGDASTGAKNVFGFSTSSDNGATYNARFVINFNGNIGIATNAPDNKLTIGGSTDSYMSFNTTSYQKFVVGSDLYGFVVYDNTSGLYRMNINSGGEVQIGNTSDQGDYKLQVTGNIYSTGSAVFAATSGNVGIGTTSPTNKLDVIGYLRATLGFIGNNGLSLYGDNSSTERLFVATSGNVGIGTGSPNASAKLDISTTTQGFLPPRMTTTQRNAISSPAAGLIIYNTTDSKLQVYTTSWIDLH